MKVVVEDRCFLEVVSDAVMMATQRIEFSFIDDDLMVLSS